MKFLVLTYPSQRADAILDALDARGLRPAAIVLDAGKMAIGTGLRRARHTMRRQGWRIMATKAWRRVRRAASRRKPAASASAKYAVYTDEVHLVDDASSETSLRLIRELKPDLIVLGSSRILPREVIAVPRLGILNSHPGLLPAYRGVDTIAWAVLNGDPAGVTIHFIDPGIDTGPIVSQEAVELAPGDTLASINRRAALAAGRLMANVVEQLNETGTVETLQQSPPGTLYRRMSSTQLDQTRRRLQDLAGA